MAFDPDAYLSGASATKEFDPDAYLASDTTLPEVVATQPEGGGGFLAKVNAALRKPSPEALQAPEAAVRELVTGMVPHDVPSYLRSIGGPVVQGYEQAKSLAEGDVSSIPFVGRIPEIAAAEDTPAGSKERYSAALKTLMDLGILAGAGGERAPSPLRTEPLVPEPPPTQSLGPGTIAGDVSRALERRFELQPEPPPDLAPSPPIEQTLANIPKEPPVFNPELGPQTIPDFPMPLKIDSPPIGTPLKPTPLLGPNGSTPAADVAAQVPPVAAAPEPYTPEAAAAREQQPSGAEPQVAEASKAGTGEGGISIKNSATDALREKYGLRPAVEAARKDLGESWAEAENISELDPGIGRRILDDINNGKITAVDDVQVAHLTRETIDAVAERNAAADAVNSAKTPEELDSAKSRRELAEKHLQSVVDADRKVGTATARGLKARQMAAREDYSLTRMESRARAAYGRKLSDVESGRESAYVKGLNDKIQELSDRLEKVQDSQERASAKNVSKEATQARKSGKRIIDYTGEAAAKARERINRQLHGLGAKPAPPTLLADYAIVGADHLARGLTTFADWSAQMVKEFGDKVNPYLKDIWVRAKAIHNAAIKAYRTPAERAESAYQTRLAGETVGLKAKLERGDFSKPTKEPPVYSKATYQMRQQLSALKGEFNRHVADIERKNATPGQKLVTHIAGILRAGVLSSPNVIGKLGVAATVRELSAPVYGVTRLGWSKIPGISEIAEASGRNPSLKGILTSEFKAKASAITQGIIDAGQSFTKRGSELDRISGKDKYTRYWYDKVTGAVHAAIKAPVKRAEFTRSLEQRIETSMRQGEDVSHPAVIDRLTNEASIDANRAILQNANAFSNWVSQLDRMGPTGKILKAVLAPVTRVPSNLTIEFWNHALGVPHALLRSVYQDATKMENITPATADSIMRQFSQGTVGLALASYAWLNHEKIGELLHALPKWFQHTSQAMVLDLFSALGNGDQKEINNMVKYDVPFVKTFTDLSEPLTNSSKPKWQQSGEPWAEYGRKLLASKLVPEVSNYVQKAEHTPGSLPEKILQLNKPVYSKEDTRRYFHPKSILDAIKERLP